MTKEMENNIMDKNNTQYFCDTTYNAVPYNNKRLKLWVLVACNKKLQHTILCSLILLYNENKETILTILDYFNQKYNFYPEITTIDFAKGPCEALKEKFPESIIILCFYHYINMIKKIYLLNLKILKVIKIFI